MSLIAVTTGLLSSLREHWGFWLATLVGVFAYGGLVVLDVSEGTLRADVTPRTIGFYLLAFAGFILAIWWQERRGIRWGWLWTVPLIFRLLLVLTTPTLSDDVYRYLWDGHLTTEGVNPYSYVIEDSRLDRYEIEARSLANNPNYATPYLPAAQLVFAGSALAAPSEPISMQLVMVGFDVAVAALLVRLLRRSGLPRGRLLLYWWNPLVIVEVAHGAHLDVLMVAFALLAVLSTLREVPSTPTWAAPVVLALATLTRPLPVLLFPVLWWRWTWPQRAMYAAATTAMVVPFAASGGWGLFGEPTPTGVFGSIRVFVREVAFNSGIYHWLESWLGRRGVADPASMARIVVALMLGAVLVDVWRRARRAVTARDLMRVAALPFMGYVILTSILHPWYVLILMALVPFVTPTTAEAPARWWLTVPWLYLAGALILSYLTYRDPLRFGEIEWVRRVEWYPTLLLIPIAARFARRPAKKLPTA